MSNVFIEQSVEVVRFNLKKRDGSGSTTYRVALDFYDNDELISVVGNEPIYPLLAQSPESKRGMGLNTGIRYNVAIQVWGKTNLDEVGTTFYDLQEEYDFQASTVEIRYYAKPANGKSTHSDSVNIRQTLNIEATNYDFNTKIMTFECIDSWFKDKEISRRIDDTLFPNVDPSYNGGFGDIPFGESVIVNAPYVKNEIDASYSPANAPIANLFLGYTGGSSFPLNGWNNIYIRNNSSRRTSSQYIDFGKTNTPQSEIFPSDANPSSPSYYDLAAHSRALHWNDSVTWVVTAVGAYLRHKGSPAAGDGEIRALIYEAEYLPASTSYQPIGGALGVGVKDPQASTVSTGGEIDIQFNPPVILEANRDYFIILEWTNPDDTTNSIECAIKSSTGDGHYSLDKSETGRTWTLQNNQLLGLGVYGIGNGSAGSVGFVDVAGTGDYRYSYYQLECRVPIIDTSEVRYSIADTLDFKADVLGIEDNSTGDITGVAGTVLKRPVQILRYFLQGPLGLSLPDSALDTASFASVQTAQADKSLAMAFSVDRETYLSDFVEEICYQGGMQLYKTRDGKLKVRNPEYPSAAKDIFLSEAFYRGDMEVVSFRENPSGSVINDVRVFYDENKLELPPDETILKNSKSGNYLGYLEVADIDDDHGTRATWKSDSENLYESRPLRKELDFYRDRESAKEVIRYYFDRYHTNLSQGEIRVLRKDWYANDLFDTIRVSHSKLPRSGGSFEELNVIDSSGTELDIKHNNLPLTCTKEGASTGEVLEWIESGPYVFLTFETTNYF